jgi:hypothetical protein
MINRLNFVEKCKLIILETDRVKQLLLIQDALDIFNSSNSIQQLKIELKVHSLENIKSTLTNFVNQENCTVADVNQMIILESQMIDD